MYFSGDTMPSMPAKRKFTDEQYEVLVNVLRNARKKYDTQESLGLAIGLTQPSLSALLSGRWRPGLSTARAIAQLAGQTLEDLLGEDFHDEAPKASPSTGPYRNLSVCVEFHHGTREWKPWTLAAARAGFFGDGDFPPALWAEKLDKLEGTLEKVKK